MGRVAWGVFRGVGRARGGALAADASVQDAEMEAIRQCLSWVEEEAGGGDGLRQRRVLVLGDSIGALQDIEAVWRAGTTEALRLRNRRGMMEDIVRLRRAMGAVVFQWVRGHGGVHCNAYADMIAKACLDEEVRDYTGEQRATAVRYEIRSEVDGRWAGVPADRRPMRLIEARLQRWLTLRWRGERDRTDGGGEEADELLIDDAWLDGGTGSYWTQLVRRSGEGGRRSGCRGVASNVGAVMMLRGGRMGLPAEYLPGRREADVVGALLTAQAKAGAGEGPADQLRRILEQMVELVPGAGEAGGRKRRRMTALRAALDEASTFIEHIAAGQRPSRQAWGRARLVFTGFWPAPTQDDWGEPAAGETGDEGGAGGGGRGLERTPGDSTLLLRTIPGVSIPAAWSSRKWPGGKGSAAAARGASAARPSCRRRLGTRS